MGLVLTELGQQCRLALRDHVVAALRWAAQRRTPQLTGTGTMVGGQSGSIDQTNAKPSSPAVLFVAVSSVPLPFKGGTLVAVPALLTSVLSTSPAGSIPLPFTMPNGLPSGLDIYYQCGIQDSAAVKGVALSNALKSTTP